MSKSGWKPPSLVYWVTMAWVPSGAQLEICLLQDGQLPVLAMGVQCSKRHSLQVEIRCQKAIRLYLGNGGYLPVEVAAAWQEEVIRDLDAVVVFKYEALRALGARGC